MDIDEMLREVTTSVSVKLTRYCLKCWQIGFCRGKSLNGIEML